MKKITQERKTYLKSPPVNVEGQNGVNYVIKAFQQTRNLGNKHLTVGKHRM